MKTVAHNKGIRSFTHTTKRNTKTVCVQAQTRVIRVCKDCVNYSEKDGLCKVLSLVNHKMHSVTNMKSLTCRTREDLCGMDAKYYEPKHEDKQTSLKDVSSTTNDDDIQNDEWVVVYNPDGSSTICGEGCNIDVYYTNMRLDYIDVY
jgi:hypothetical protein